ncbi:MAG: ABC transporter transmembrane domain-containing protein, partial [Planctomycetota bacterium]
MSSSTTQTAPPKVPFSRLFALTRGERGRYAAAIACLAGSLTAGFAVPLLLARPLDAFAAGDPMPVRELGATAALVVVATLVAGAFSALQGRLSALASQNITKRLRDTIHRQLHRLPLEWHDRVETGDIVQRCSSDVDTIRAFLAAQVVEIGRALLMVGIAVPILFAVDASLALWSVCLLPVIGGSTFWFFSRIRSVFTGVDEAD